jgi:hypothetical protein
MQIPAHAVMASSSSVSCVPAGIICTKLPLAIAVRDYGYVKCRKDFFSGCTAADLRDLI